MDDLEVTFSDAGPFLERARSHLAVNPVLSTVVSTVAARMAAIMERCEKTTPAPYSWFAVVTEHGGEVVGAAMRTAPFAPHPVYVLPMPDPAAIALSESVLAREPVTAVNGARRASEAFAATVASRTGGGVAVDVHTRLFELGELVDPRPVLGRIRNATVAEAPFALDWFHRFHRDADVQAGRPPTRGARSDHMTVADIEELIRGGHMVLGRPCRPAGAPHRIQTAGLRRGPHRSRVHTDRAPWPRIRQRHGRRGVAPAPRQRRQGHAVHRPGQPHLKQDL